MLDKILRQKGLEAILEQLATMPDGEEKKPEALEIEVEHEDDGFKKPEYEEDEDTIFDEDAEEEIPEEDRVFPEIKKKKLA